MLTIEQRCIDLIAKAKGIGASTVHTTSTFEELGLDSLDKVTIAFDVEEAFGISIPERALQQITTVQAMVDGVVALLPGDKAEPR